MSLVLDSGAVSALSGQRARLQELQRRGLWPAQLPSVVLTEILTGDHRPDWGVNRLLRACLIRPVDEPLAREAARLRTATGRAGAISAVDALVVALADSQGGGVVLTGDPDDLRALAAHASSAVSIGGV